LRLFKPRSLKIGIQLALIFTILSKIVGYLRQLLVAYFFGVSRDMDIYMMTFNLTMLLMLSYTMWFDQISVAHLVRTKETKGDAAFRELCGSVLTFSIVMAVALAVVFVLLLNPATWVICHGFTPVERLRVRYLGLFFIPWILTIIPYNALTAIVKCLRYYDAVLFTDFLVSLIATAGFAFRHSHLVSLPLALSLGYGLAFVGLAIFARRFVHLSGPLWSINIRSMYNNFIQMFMVSQTSFLASGVERFFQSYLRSGSIAAAGYSYQILWPMSELLAFDELYVISLSSVTQRTQRLERLLKGIVLLTIPIACFFMWHASTVVRILYQHGHFNADAQELTARILRILAVTLVTGTFLTPLIRVLQLTNHILYTGVVSVAVAFFFFVSNSVFVFKLHWDVLGTVTTSILGSAFSVLLAFFLLHRTGTRLHYLGILKYVIWALISTLIAMSLVFIMPDVHGPHLLIMGLHGFLFGVFIAILYWPVRRNIQFILNGK